MKAKNILLGIALFALISCNNQPQTIEKNSPEHLYNDAGKMVQAMKYDSAIVLLRLAFDQGFEHPMGIVTDSSFSYLIENPQYRSAIRKLLKAFAVKNHATMVSAKEPGSAIVVKGIIRDESSSLPIESVVVELIHTDNNGFYFEEKSLWNPRLFAYLKTDLNGVFAVNTIMPGRYQDDDGNVVPSHIHFTLEAEGYRTYASEFTFENDSVFKANGNLDSVPVALLKKENGKDYYQVTLNMQKE